MQTFDQALYNHLAAGRITENDAMLASTTPHDLKLLLAADGRKGTTMADVDEAAIVAGDEPTQAPGGGATPPAGDPNADRLASYSMAPAGDAAAYDTAAYGDAAAYGSADAAAFAAPPVYGGEAHAAPPVAYGTEAPAYAEPPAYGSDPAAYAAGPEAYTSQTGSLESPSYGETAAYGPPPTNGAVPDEQGTPMPPSSYGPPG